MYSELYDFWGLRDRGSKVHFLVEPYLASMSLPRYRDSRFALADEEALSPGLDVPSEHLACTLQPFPDDPPCMHCDSATAEAGILGPPSRCACPEAFYKPYVVPWREVRVGMGVYDWSEGRGEVSLGFAGDFRHMTGGLLPMPAWLVLESGWKPFGKQVAMPLGGESRYVFSRSASSTGNAAGCSC